MRLHILLAALATLTAITTNAQVEPDAGTWKTWFISSAKDYRLPKPIQFRYEIAIVEENQKKIDSDMLYQINYWNAGSPGYRWQQMMTKLWMNDTSYNGIFAAMLLNAAIYDATVAAWDTKYKYKRARPFEVDKRIKSYVVNPESPSYPCEVAVTAGVASTIIAHFYPNLTDSVKKMAVRAMTSRIAAGVAFASDTSAGFALGKRIAEIEIERTKNYPPKNTLHMKMPQEPGKYAGQTEDLLTKKIFEYNLHLNPPRAARIYSIAAMGIYDGFISCRDAKYTYPSRQAVVGAVNTEICSYFFPEARSYFRIVK